MSPGRLPRASVRGERLTRAPTLGSVRLPHSLGALGCLILVRPHGGGHLGGPCLGQGHP